MTAYNFLRHIQTDEEYVNRKIADLYTITPTGWMSGEQFRQVCMDVAAAYPYGARVTLSCLFLDLRQQADTELTRKFHELLSAVH